MKMGKRKLAATISGTDHSSEKSCYSSQGISAHLRGWDFGYQIEMKMTEDETPYLMIFSTGGSHNPLPQEMLAIINPKGVVE
jgi:hypothetical protein